MSIILSSCPCKKLDAMRQCDYCTVSGAKVEGVMICDVDFGYCPDYLSHKKSRPRAKKGKGK